MKHLAFFVITPILLIAGVFAYQNWQGQKSVQSESQSALLEKAVPTYSSTPTTTEEPICDNYKEIQTFEKPIPIIWTAKLTGCLVSCFGAHFTRLPEGAKYKYPRFAGYYPDASGKYNWNDEGRSQIPDKFLKDNIVLKIYGNWTMIDADHPYTVFENKCVPIIEIKKIEIKI